MSSLLQFRGTTTKGRVNLQMVLIRKEPWVVGDLKGLTRDVDSCGFYTPEGKWYSTIWIVPRKPKGMFGCWVVFRYNGEDQVPDLSCPISVTKLPRDARPLSSEESLKLWHS